ncbi:MAG: epoxyqueuosine reductase QueH [Endomicrobiia bacterium]|nr:epoxyqueuosine reductase QueH [Endomicrobiia bacterium]
MTRKLLIHQCCAVCSASFFERIPSGFRVSGFWFNPNIERSCESLKRETALREFNAIKGVETLGLRGDAHKISAAQTSPMLPRPQRCRTCYKIRMDETARVAAESGFEAFSTTLLASPYQEHESAKAAAEDAARRFGVGFVYIDSRDIYYDGKRFAVLNRLYSQKYCGCAMSLAERLASGK